MCKKLLSSLLFSQLALSPFGQQTTPKHFDGKTWWEHVKVVADDRMEGRDTGSEGLRKAEAYVVDQLTEIGLQPEGTNGFYQPVKFVSRQIVEKDSSIALIRNGVEQPLVLGDDAYFNTRVDLAAGELAAPLVFMGYGLQIPEKGYDDLAGLDLRGKIAVILTGSPADIPTALASHYQWPGERWKVFGEAGAIGIITIPNPASMDIPWTRMSLNRAHPQMEIADPEFHELAGQKVALTWNPARAETLFAGSGHTFQELADWAKDRKPLPRFPLPVSLRSRASVQTHEVTSDNVIAKLPGSDRQLKNEFVVLSAHIDHLGIGEPINGDRIYNGAMDNGSGVALLLDMAASLRQEKLRRSILFVFVTAEEKGLLGSKYFAARPTVDSKSIVADINVDMFLPIVPLTVLKVKGLAESDLGDQASRAAESLGVRVQADPLPLRNSFIRSDQYNFVRHGVPSLNMEIGYDLGSPEQQIFKDWLTNHYHAPSDDTSQPLNLSAAALYEETMRKLLVTVANSDARPQWKPDSFFQRYTK
ncbi:MAG TPA: M28 family metallopeptidase [Candidatus Sulfotelmatobacter sp.]|nr:M28 family metallopeptidase [Candidatus Sulfotelmatobacter sp.]